MSNTKTKSKSSHWVAAIDAPTRVSSFDMLNGFLIAAIILIGFLVTLLFLIWLTMVIGFSDRQPAVLAATDQPFGNEKPEGFEDDIYEPGVEELPEIETPQLKDSLEAVTDAVSTVRSNLEARDGDAAEMGRGRGFGSRDGGPGMGDGDIIPEYQRWKIDYDSNSLQEYAQQLSFFRIDIGVVDENSNNIIRIRDPGGAPSIINSDRGSEKSSLYFSHEKQRFRRWDDTLSRQNQVVLDQRFTVQFYPDPTRRALRQIEQAYLAEQGRSLEDVRRTFFKVVPVDNGYEFQVTGVDYRL